MEHHDTPPGVDHVGMAVAARDPRWIEGSIAPEVGLDTDSGDDRP